MVLPRKMTLGSNHLADGDWPSRRRLTLKLRLGLQSVSRPVRYPLSSFRPLLLGVLVQQDLRGETARLGQVLYILILHRKLRCELELVPVRGGKSQM